MDELELEDYSYAIIRIQQLHKQIQKELQAKQYGAARNTARKIAVDATLIGSWCRKFVDKTKEEELPF
jgi:hypothetical protein